MQPKYLTSLEFDKILSRAAQGVVCPEARGLLLEEQPGDTCLLYTSRVAFKGDGILVDTYQKDRITAHGRVFSVSFQGKDEVNGR